MSKNRHKLPVAVYLIFQQNDKILLSLRSNTGYRDGWYSVVSGHLEAGESIFETAKREAMEEANIIPSSLKPLAVIHRNPGSLNDRAAEYIDYFFICDSWQGEIKNNEPDKCAALAFFDLHNLPNNIIPYIKNIVSKIHTNSFIVDVLKDNEDEVS